MPYSFSNEQKPLRTNLSRARRLGSCLYASLLSPGGGTPNQEESTPEGFTRAGVLTGKKSWTYLQEGADPNPQISRICTQCQSIQLNEKILPYFFCVREGVLLYRKLENTTIHR